MFPAWDRVPLPGSVLGSSEQRNYVGLGRSEESKGLGIFATLRSNGQVFAVSRAGAFQVGVLWKESSEGEGAYSILEAERPTCL